MARCFTDWQSIKNVGFGPGFFVDTVGRDTETIRKYVAEQEMEDRRLDQLEMPEITPE